MKLLERRTIVKPPKYIDAFELKDSNRHVYTKISRGMINLGTRSFAQSTMPVLSKLTAQVANRDACVITAAT